MKRAQKFNNFNRLNPGWYGVLRSKDLKKQQTKKVFIIDREVLFVRDDQGIVRAYNPYCPHMKSDLSYAKVDKKGLHCPGHGWNFDHSGKLSHIPCRKGKILDLELQKLSCQEDLGLIWFNPDPETSLPLPRPHELQGPKVRARAAKSYITKMHPHVIFSKMIDIQRYRRLNEGDLDLKFEFFKPGHDCAAFHNRTTIPKTNLFKKMIAKLYAQYFTYNITFWSGATALVTWGPDFLNIHILIAATPIDKNKTQVHICYLAPFQKGLSQMLVNQCRYFLSARVRKRLSYLEDTDQSSAELDLCIPLREDEALRQFTSYIENLPDPFNDEDVLQMQTAVHSKSYI